MLTAFQEAIILRYETFGHPSDEIVIEDSLLERFLDSLPPRFRSVQKSEVRRQLLRLRKRGELPRSIDR
jgi:hypothetical protein